MTDRTDKSEKRAYNTDANTMTERYKSNVPNARGKQKPDVRRRAVALKYDAERGAAPLITAVGKGQVADRIIEVAEQSGVARVEDELQANALSSFDAGARVPKFLYDLVAEVLLFIEEADTQNQGKRKITNMY